MGTLTLAGFRTEVRYDLKNRPDTSSSGLSDTRLNQHINNAYLQVAHPSFHKHRSIQYTFTLPLVSGTNSYTFSPIAGVEIQAIRSVTYLRALVNTPTVAKNKLRAHDVQWFDDKTLVSGGRTADYAVEGNDLLVSPVPGPNEAGHLLFLRTLREPSLLAADGSVTVLQNVWDEVILLGARWRAELHLGYRDLSEATKLDFAALANEYQSFDALHGMEEWDWSKDLVSESVMEGSPS